MIIQKGKTSEQILKEYQELKEIKVRKIKRIKALMKERPVPDDVLQTLGIYNKQTPITDDLREEARNAFFERQEARLIKQEDSLKLIEKELSRRI
jgi:hypothetical protein